MKHFVLVSCKRLQKFQNHTGLSSSRSHNYPLGLAGQRAKKVVSDSLGLVDFTIGPVKSVLKVAPLLM